jgi:GMP synthase (glutamine-hydrolysing)
MHNQILIIDFGSQYTQLIARRIREFNVYCEIHPFNDLPKLNPNIKGVILSGSPYSVLDNHSPSISINDFCRSIPVLGICYGAQMIINNNNGIVEKSDKREYGRATISVIGKDPIFNDISAESSVWMSHGDSIKQTPNHVEILAKTSTIPVAAFKVSDHNFPVYGFQFHPEVTHTIDGKKMLGNFLFNICNCTPSWTPDAFIESTISDLKNKIGKQKVILGLSGGVDSSVAAFLIHKAIGENLHCIFVDNGVLRKNEFEEVLEKFKGFGLNVVGVSAGDKFLNALDGIEDPEFKRKIIGKTFIDVFEHEAKKIAGAVFLAQGTIYPDVIESAGTNGPAVTIKSHHNVGGLPEKMNLKVIEPMRMLFKDEVRKVGNAMNLSKDIIDRHPFPGPGLAIRTIGAISREKIKILQDADYIYINALKDKGLYDKVWQAGAILLPVKTVGVMGDERTYEYVVCLRAVNSIDGMTADWSLLPHEFLQYVSNKIINEVKGINRVAYDISSKPPATIEWE